MANGSILGTHARAPTDLPVHAGIRAEPMDFPEGTARAMHGNGNCILGKIATFLPAVRDSHLERLLLGFRPMPTGEVPVVGALPTTPGVHVAVTHIGATLARTLGQGARSSAGYNFGPIST